MKLPFNIDLNGKVAVVTGAGGVLMSEFAKALAESGAKVALLDINEAAVVKLAEEIGANGGEHTDAVRALEADATEYRRRFFADGINV